MTVKKPDSQIVGTRGRDTDGKFVSVKEGRAELLERERSAAVENVLLLEERIAELEFSLEDEGWRQVGSSDEEEFTNSGIARIIRLARLSYLKNPLIRHGVEVTCEYVFGQGWTITGHDKVGQVIEEVMTDKNNLAVLTSHQAMIAREVQQESEGNTFFALFTNESNGYTRFSIIPTGEILDGDIIRNPDNRMEVWYYKRVFKRSKFSTDDGSFDSETVTEYHPDWRYEPDDKPDVIGGNKVRWERPVYHVKTGGLPAWKFGIPEYYSAIDWGRAVTGDLEDYASLKKAYARFAWQLTTPSGKRAVAAARKRLNTTLPGGAAELAEQSTSGRNGAPAAASTFIGAEGYSLNPVRTAGAAASPEEGRRLWYMVSAGMGIPEPILAGDATLGTYATAKTLDRPTELKMKNRQSLWKDVFQDLLGYVIDQAIKAPSGLLPGTVVNDERRGGERIEIGPDPDAEPLVNPDGTPMLGEDGSPLTPEPMDRTVDVDFPDILERDVKERIGAIVTAATLDGKAIAGTIPPKVLVRLLLNALGEQGSDVDAVLEVLFPSDALDDDQPLEPVAPSTTDDATDPGLVPSTAANDEEALAEAQRQFVEAANRVAGA